MSIRLGGSQGFNNVKRGSRGIVELGYNPVRSRTASPTMNPSGATPVTGAPTYRCEDVEMDSAQGYLKRGGREQYLRQQSFHVLLYLLERRQRLITKEELIETFWHDTAVTDNALVQCIAEIRKALGDDPRQARFVKTIPKVGYRFISAVEEETPAVSPVQAVEARDGNASLIFPEGARGKPWVESRLSLILIALALVTGIPGLWLVLRGSAGAPAEVTPPRVPRPKPNARHLF